VLQRAGHLMQLPACAPCFAGAVGPSQLGPSQGLRPKAGPSAPGAGEAALPERARAHGAAQCQDEHGRQEPQDRARGCGRRLCRQRRRHARYAPPRRPPPRRRPPGAARCGLPGAAASRGAAGLRPARIAGATRTRPASPCGGRAGSARCPWRLESSGPTRQLVGERHSAWLARMHARHCAALETGKPRRRALSEVCNSSRRPMQTCAGGWDAAVSTPTSSSPPSSRRHASTLQPGPAGAAGPGAGRSHLGVGDRLRRGACRAQGVADQHAAHAPPRPRSARSAGSGVARALGPARGRPALQPGREAGACSRERARTSVAARRHHDSVAG